MKRFVLFFFWLIACFAAPHEESPLMAPARAGDTAELRRLVANGADPNERGGVNDWTPLMHAIHKNQIGSVEALLDLHANPNATSGGGETSLMMAAGYGQTAIVRLLLKRGADPRITDRDGETALDYALAGTADIDDFTFFTCQDSTVRALLAGGAPPRASLAAFRAVRVKMCESRKLVAVR
jgi:hypothetical protein